MNLPSSTLCYGTYEELLSNPDIDAVYIPLPTAEHLKWVTSAALQGKHILLEKPCAISAQILHEIITICLTSNVVLMDGVMFNHHCRTRSLLKELHDPFLGISACRVHSSFSFKADDRFYSSNIRASSSNDPLGALGDLAWYCIRLGLLAFSEYSSEDYLASINSTHSTGLHYGLQFPRTVPTCQVKSFNWSIDGLVPLDCEGRVSFGFHHKRVGDQVLRLERVLVFDSSFLLPLRQTFEISSVARSYFDADLTRGVSDKIFRCRDFVIPNKPSSASFSMQSMGDGSLTDRATRYHSCEEEVAVAGPILIDQEVAMFTEFARIVIEKDRRGKVWAALSMATQLICDACMQSLRSDGESVAVDEQLWLQLGQYTQ
jgi:hypothetical protein